jgi:hypothetical protein
MSVTRNRWVVQSWLLLLSNGKNVTASQLGRYFARECARLSAAQRTFPSISYSPKSPTLTPDYYLHGVPSLLLGGLLNLRILKRVIEDLPFAACGWCGRRSKTPLTLLSARIRRRLVVSGQRPLCSPGATDLSCRAVIEEPQLHTNNCPSTL